MSLQLANASLQTSVRTHGRGSEIAALLPEVAPRKDEKNSLPPTTEWLRLDVTIQS